jgi:hypothetical protein
MIFQNYDYENLISWIIEYRDVEVGDVTGLVLIIPISKWVFI